MFKGRHFDRLVILLCVRRYLAYNPSLRDLEEMLTVRGIGVDHSAIHCSIGGLPALRRQVCKPESCRRR